MGARLVRVLLTKGLYGTQACTATARGRVIHMRYCLTGRARCIAYVCACVRACVRVRWRAAIDHNEAGDQTCQVDFDNQTVYYVSDWSTITQLDRVYAVIEYVGSITSNTKVILAGCARARVAAV